MDRKKNYLSFSVQGFVFDDYFRKWILHPDTETDLFWIGWLSEHPDKEDTITAAREIVLSLKPKVKQITDSQIETMISNTVGKILDPQTVIPTQETEYARQKFKVIYWFSGIAAALIIAFVTTWYQHNQDHSVYQYLVHHSSDQLIEKINPSDTNIVIVLADGSHIGLYEHSRISYPTSFTGKKYRQVYLDGIASFSVTKNPLKPFLVYANGIMTRVLGTKFVINSDDQGSQSSIAVTSGVVSVTKFQLVDHQPEMNKAKDGAVILTRNQKANYNSQNDQLVAGLVDLPQMNKADDMEYKFTQTNIAVIFKDIKNDYGIDVIFDEKALGSRFLTANLSKKTLYEKLDIICKVLKCNYEVIDRKIFINQQHNTE